MGTIADSCANPSVARTIPKGLVYYSQSIAGEDGNELMRVATIESWRTLYMRQVQMLCFVAPFSSYLAMPCGRTGRRLLADPKCNATMTPATCRSGRCQSI